MSEVHLLIEDARGRCCDRHRFVEDERTVTWCGLTARMMDDARAPQDAQLAAGAAALAVDVSKAPGAVTCAPCLIVAMHWHAVHAAALSAHVSRVSVTLYSPQGTARAVPALGFCEQCGEDVGLVELSPGGPARLVAHVHRERGAICIGSGRRASVLRRPATRS